MNVNTAPQIYKRISSIMQDLKPIGRDQKNQIQRFNFRGIDDVYNGLKPLLAKYEVFTTSEILSDRTEERTTKNGGALIYRVLKMKYTFYTVDGSSVSTEVIGEAMDSGDKACNKAMSIAHKYALTQIFSIATESHDDPDQESHEVAPKTEDIFSKTNDVHRNRAITFLSDYLEADAIDKMLDLFNGKPMSFVKNKLSEVKKNAPQNKENNS